MRIDYFLCFEAIKRYRNFSKAAENLYVSQSTLSKQLKSFEDKLGVVLFDRSRSTIQLTPIGERISKHVEVILNEYDEIMLEAKNHVIADNKKLRIASLYEMAQYGITDLIVSFEYDKPNFHIESQECDHSRMLHLLHNRQTDIIIGYRELWQNEIEGVGYYSMPLRKDDLVLVAHVNHPIGMKEVISLADVRNEMFCFPREDSSIFDFFKDACKSAGFAPKLTLSDVRLGTIKQYILKGMRITLQTRIRATSFFHEPIFHLVDIKETPFLTLTLMTNKSLLSDTGNQFIEFARNFYNIEY